MHSYIFFSATQTEKRINELIREKENMATEIWQLKRDLEKVTSNDPDHVTGERNHLDNYDPDSPKILKRKLGKCQSHYNGQIFWYL